MNGIGTKLRLAREALGYSQGQIAEKTRILPQIVAGLENEDYSRIVAPIYGRGFVKLYAQAVGLDPAECSREFMESYNGIGSVPEQGKSPIDKFVKPKTEQECEASGGDGDESRATEAQPEEARAEEEPAYEEPPARRAVSRYAPPMPEEPRSNGIIPPFVWRIAIVAVCAAAFVWAIVAGLKALYRATCTPAPGEVVQEVAQPVPASAEPAASAPQAEATAKPRKPVERLPDMYAD